MIFISYSWSDSTFARHLATLLKVCGHQVWVDYKYLNLAQPLEPQLVQAIWMANTFLLIDSPNARNSKWVQFELTLAKDLHRSTQIVYTFPENSIHIFGEIIDPQVVHPSYFPSNVRMQIAGAK